MRFDRDALIREPIADLTAIADRSNSAPAVIPAASRQARTAAVGQAIEPRTMPMAAPWPS
jgi:hypothetical protein